LHGLGALAQFACDRRTRHLVDAPKLAQSIVATMHTLAQSPPAPSPSAISHANFVGLVCSVPSPCPLCVAIECCAFFSHFQIPLAAVALLSFLALSAVSCATLLAWGPAQPRPSAAALASARALIIAAAYNFLVDCSLHRYAVLDAGGAAAVVAMLRAIAAEPSSQEVASRSASPAPASATAGCTEPRIACPDTKTGTSPRTLSENTPTSLLPSSTSLPLKDPLTCRLSIAAVPPTAASQLFGATALRCAPPQPSIATSPSPRLCIPPPLWTSRQGSPVPLLVQLKSSPSPPPSSRKASPTPPELGL